MADADGTASIALSAAAGPGILPGPWVDLDLSLVQFMYNPAIPSVPFGQYSGGVIQGYPSFGSGSVLFEHPFLSFDDLDPDQNYEFEVTYDTDTEWTFGQMVAYPFTGAESAWDDPDILLKDFGGFNSTGVPGVLSFTVGPQEPFYQSAWALAVGSDYHALAFAFTSRAYIPAIRYRTTEGPRVAITASAQLSFSASDSTPIDTSSPFEVDTTFTTVVNVGTQVGTGNILADDTHTTYYQLDGYNNVTTPDLLLSGWLLIDIPALPDYNSLISITVNMRAEFYAITGSPTRANLRLFLTNGDSASPITYANYYALVLPSNNYPATSLLPTGITDYAYGTDDFQSQVFGMTLSEALAAPLKEGRLQLGFAPQRYFADNFSTTRVQAKVYELSLTIAYNEYVAPVFDDPPDLPSGYGPWEELDLSTAIFFDDNPGVPTGEYDAEKDRILNATGSTWPDFYFPGFLLDPDNDYMFQFVYDSYDLRDDETERDLYIWTILASGDPQDEYDNGNAGASDSADAYPGDYRTFLFDSSDQDWATLLDGYTRPVFESTRNGVLARIRYAVSPGTPDSYTPPPTFVDEHVRARSHFWGQR